MSILRVPYIKIAEKGTVFIFGQKTEKVVSDQATWHFFFVILIDFSLYNFLYFLVFNIKLQVFGRSNDVPRPSVVEEIQFSEEVACGGYHTCVVTGIIFVL